MTIHVRRGWALALGVMLAVGASACGADDEGEPGEGGGGTEADVTSGDTQEGDGTGGTGEADTLVDPKCELPEFHPCNALCNTGCGEGEACLFNAGDWACAPAGTVVAGGECDGPADCQSGACATNEGDGIPRCIAPCLDSTDCEGGGECNVTVEGALPFKFCGDPAATGCKPLKEGECDEGLACYLANQSTQCLAPGDKLQGEPCTSPNQCAESLVCLNVAGVSGCVRMCSTAGSDSGTPISCETLCGLNNFQQVDKDSKTGYCQSDVDFPVCDPVAPDCQPGKGCVWSSDGWVCLGTGSKEEGEACSSPTDCQDGLVCYASKCKVFCDPSMATNNPACSAPNVPCVTLGGTGGYCDQ
jgi:hypothetical protein